MKNQERLIAYVKAYLSEKGLDAEEFDKQWNSSEFSREFSFFGIVNIEVTHRTWQENKCVQEKRMLKVCKREGRLSIHHGLHGYFDYVPEWTTGDGNYFFFNFDSSGKCRKLRIYFPPEDRHKPFAGDIKTCLHSVTKPEDYTQDELDFTTESSFNVASVYYGEAALVDSFGCLAGE